MRHMYGVEIHVPAGKLPGFYAQVIHKIGDHVNVFDRDNLLFIVENEAERDKLEAVLSKSGMLGDRFSLLLLPSSAQIDTVEDIGFVSQSEHLYLYAERVALFTFAGGTENEQDRWAAQEQLREHVSGQFPATASSTPVFILDNAQTELADGIARAYGQSLVWLHRGE
ncbi:hypothetical protein ACFSO0_14030 [Brevibacillus sp. GCM10020057]|uniref:hypothetical protein n=1 Tax=Brevibacillus sp. GCM10020057 TaxID=3317327 RepID=UPI00362C06F8